MPSMEEKERVWTAVFDYEASREDELTLRRGEKVELLSKDHRISGDVGWWTGKIEEKIGVFPADFVHEKVGEVSPDSHDNARPFEIDFNELSLEDVIGLGGFGQVYKGKLFILNSFIKSLIS